MSKWIFVSTLDDKKKAEGAIKTFEKIGCQAEIRERVVYDIYWRETVRKP